MAGDKVTVGYGKFSDGLNSGMKWGSIVAVSGTNVVGAKNGDEELEFALVNECINGSSNSVIIDSGSAKGSGGDKKRGAGVRESGIEVGLSV
jgi:hypothetical protein